MSKETQSNKMSEKPKIGLALGSGLARGFAHIGVLRALDRYGIEPVIVSGTSMGALVGGAWQAGKLDALEEWALSLTRYKVFSYLDLRVRGGGLIGGKKLERLMNQHFGETQIKDLPNPFVAIASDMATGHEVWMRNGRLVDVLRASFALPGVFPPVLHENRFLVDGALTNPVPVSVCQALGAHMTIAVDLNADMIGKSRHKGEKIPTIAGFDVYNEADFPKEKWTSIVKTGIAKRLFRREPDNPSLFGVMVSALNITQDRLTRSRLAGDPPDIHIKPRVGQFGLMEFEKAKDMIAEGEAAVERKISDILGAYEIFFGQSIEDEDQS